MVNEDSEQTLRVLYRQKTKSLLGRMRYILVKKIKPCTVVINKQPDECIKDTTHS